MQRPPAENARNKRADSSNFRAEAQENRARLENYGTAGELTKPVGADGQCEKQTRVITDVHQETGDYGRGARARGGKDDANDDEQSDLPPAAQKLPRWRPAKNSSGEKTPARNPKSGRRPRIKI